MKIKLPLQTASKLIAARIVSGKSISALMEEAMVLLVEKYDVMNLEDEEFKERVQSVLTWKKEETSDLFYFRVG